MSLDLLGTVSLFDPSPRVVVRVVVALPVAESRCTLVVGVAQVRWYQAGAGRPGIGRSCGEGTVDPVRLGGGRQVDDRLGQVEAGLGQADELDGTRRCVGHDQRHGVGHADVLAGQDDEAADDEAGVLPRFEHSGQPVEAGVRIGAPDALDEGADDVVVLVAAVADRLGAECGLGIVEGDRGVVPAGGEGDGDLEAGQGEAAVAGGTVGQQVERLVGGGRLLGLQSPAQQQVRGLAVQGLEAEQRGTRQEWWVDLKVRVLRRGSDEDQQPGLHGRQQGVLLGLVEAVDLVEEQDRADVAFAKSGQGGRHHLSDVLDAGVHGREFHELLGGDPGDQPGQRGLAGARWPPEHHRREPVLLDEPPQWLFGPDEVLLADDVVESDRTQAVGERCTAGQALPDRRGEQVVGHDIEPSGHCWEGRGADQTATPNGRRRRRSRRRSTGPPPGDQR